MKNNEKNCTNNFDPRMYEYSTKEFGCTKVLSLPQSGLGKMPKW